MTSTADFQKLPSIFSEEDLVHQIQLQNEKAFSRLYDAYAASLFGSIKKIISCSLTAEDILQNVFIKIWSNAGTYSAQKGSLFTWMLRIAKNESIDYLRSKQSKRASLTSPIEENAVTVPVAVAELYRFDMSRSLSLIPQKERVIIHLYTSGFTCAEIGRLLSIPEGTVKTKMRAAYQKLRFILA